MRERVISKRIDDFSRSARNLTLETKRRFFFAYKIDMNENVYFIMNWPLQLLNVAAVIEHPSMRNLTFGL